MHPRTFRRAAPGALLLLAAAAAPLAAQERGEKHGHGSHGAHGAHGAAASRAGTLLPGLGDWHLAITTRSPRAQQLFDQVLRLAYGFNHDEAERSFAEAARLDPTCAMCRWGVAYAVTPNINMPMSPDAERKAHAAITEARRLSAKRSTAKERALIAAMAKRVGVPAGARRAARDSAYASAMRTVAARYPDDADAQVLFADAMMNLRPWNQWTRDGQPHPGTLEVVATLERALARTPDHAGACHFYVHAVEASETPDRALPCAERLPRLMPGAGHVVHMPAHIFLRVGRYGDAARANVAAVAADRKYMAGSDVPAGMYSIFYTRHNPHFLWAVYLLSGQRAPALREARALAEGITPEIAAMGASVEAYLTTPVLTLTRFGDWEAVLAEPAPAPGLRYARGMWHHARGLALLERNDVAGAQAQLDSLRTIAAGMSDSVIVILNPATSVLALGADVLAGEIAIREGRTEAGLERLREAVRREDRLTYDEPPPWYHSTRNRLGLALLGTGKVAEAEAAFRDDLRAYRENGWSLAGLERALRAQGKDAEANAVAARLATAWREADVPAIASR